MRNRFITILLLFLSSSIFSQVITQEKIKKVRQDNIFKKVFKYATPFVSYSEQNSLQGVQTFYVTQQSELIETTIRNPNNFAFNFGIRKLARYGFQDKVSFYTGNEEKSSSQDANIGNVDGIEYLFNYSNGRMQGQEFINKDFFVRYVGKRYILKAEYLKNEMVDIEYASFDARWRIPIGKRLNLSIGGIVRSNPIAYGHNPIQKYFDDGNPWYLLSYEYANHTDQIYQQVDFNGNIIGYDYFWFDQNGNQMASSDEEYRRVHFGRIVNRYNAEKLAEIGDFIYLSGTVGADYYFYRRSIWLHAYANALSYHKLLEGDERFSYDNFIGDDKWVDIKSGLTFGFKINRWFGLFTEYNYQTYWGKEIQSIKTGININF